MVSMGMCWKTVPWDEDETACLTLRRLEALLVEKGCNLLEVYGGGEVGSCSKLGAEFSHESFCVIQAPSFSLGPLAKTLLK
jgi:hypothetical protein